MFEYGDCRRNKNGKNYCDNGLHIKRCKNYNEKNNYYCKFGDTCRFLHIYIKKNCHVNSLLVVSECV